MRERARKKRRARRIGAWAFSLIAVALVGIVAWIGIRGLMARSDLETARAMISQLKTEIADLDTVAARKTFDEISRRTDNARELTSDPVWRAGEYVPWLGKNLTVVREVAEVTDTVMTDVGAPLVDVAQNIDPAAFAPKDGAIDLAPFEAAGPVLVEANVAVKKALDVAAAIDTAGTIGPVAEAKTKFRSLLGGVAPMIDTLAAVVPLLPPALGSEEPRTYVVMFQNPAEARALGGASLSFAVVNVDKGHIDLQDSIPAGFANFNHYGTSVIPIPEGAEAVYPDGAFGTFIANATIRPSFTTAALMTQEMWLRQFGTGVDGIASIDPVALSYVLRATDPITLESGDKLSSENLVSLLLNEVYLRYNSGDDLADNKAQDVVYNSAVDATFDRLVGGPLDPKILIAALIQGWSEHRILFWSAHEDEEAALAEIGLNGELPISDESTERFGVYFQDNVGSKLNFYLKTAVELAQAQCVPDQRNYRVSVGLTSTLPLDQVDSLSPSIVGQWKREGLKPGVQRMIVYLYAPPGSTITGATVNGQPVSLAALHDTDYPVGRITLSVDPASTATITYDVATPSVQEKTLEALVTPLVWPTVVTQGKLDCATVGQN